MTEPKSQTVVERIRDLAARVPVKEDAHGIFFGYGRGWGNKCDNLTDVAETFAYLLEEADRDHTLHGKLMRSPALIFEPAGDRPSSGISHSIPEEAKPEPDDRRAGGPDEEDPRRPAGEGPVPKRFGPLSPGLHRAA